MSRPRKSRVRGRSRHVPGAPPGVLEIDPDATKPVIRIIAYGPNEVFEAGVADVGVIPHYLKRWPVVWVNVDGLGDEETLVRLGGLFGLHRLALEDVVTLHQRAKTEEYGDHLFIVSRMLEATHPVATEQLSIFVGQNFVLTFQEHPGDCLDEVRKRIREGKGRIRESGADYLAYCVLDAVVDFYFPRIDLFSDLVEELEEEVLASPTSHTIAKLHALKRDLLAMRRTLSPLREAINSLIRHSHAVFSDTTRVYLRDCHDHIIQILEMTETYREILGGLVDIYLSSVSNRLNDVMKVLTVIATIFIPLTFIVGIYGMNFDTEVSPWNMPELEWYWGYPAFLLILAAIAALELFVFWRKGWLRRSRPAPSLRLDRTSAPPVIDTDVGD